MQCFYRHLLFVLSAIVWHSKFADSDNGIGGAISDLCLSCIQRIQPGQDEICIPDPKSPNTLLCGPFKISQPFHADCSVFQSNIPEEWKDWKMCYSNYECSKSCVRAYHNHYHELCQSSKPMNMPDLTCADYGQMHYAGPNSCGKDTATDAIQNMTLMCGCQTIEGDREKCLKTSANEKNCKEETKPSEDTSYTLIIVVGTCCGLAILICIVIIAFVCIKSKRSKRTITDSSANRVEGQRFQPHQLSSNKYHDFSPTKFSSNRNHIDPATINAVYSMSHKPHSSSGLSSPDSMDSPDSNANSAGLSRLPEYSSPTASVTSTLDREIAAADSQQEELQLPGYINFASLTSECEQAASHTLSNGKVRPPIPLPRVGSV